MSQAPPTSANLFKWADYYLQLGCSVIPLREGKRPAVAWKEYQSRQPTRLELGKWFVDSGYGMALVCGRVSGDLIRLDFDDPADYEKLKGQLPTAPTFRSQRQGGGWGVLLRSKYGTIPTLPQKTFPKYPKVEVRGEGSITVVPPTPGYLWTINPDTIPTVDVSNFLASTLDFDLTNRPTLAGSVESSATGELAELLKETTEGERSNNLVRIASMLRARGIDLETALQVMRLNFDRHWSHKDMSWSEAKTIFANGWKRYEHEGVRVTQKRSTPETYEDGEEDVEAVFIENIKSRTEADSLIERLVLAGEEGNTIIAAPTKMGKTSLILDACITATRGEPVWGAYAVSHPLKIAYIDQERKFNQIRENQMLMTPVIGEPKPECLMLLAQKTGQFEADHRAVMTKLWNTLVKFEPDLVVLDGWGWFVGHQDSNSEVVKPAMAWVKKLRQELNCATIIIHHFKKAQFASGKELGGDPLDKIAGLKRLVDQSQTALVYTSIPNYDTFNLLSGKTNKPSWDPCKTVIDYDDTTLTHKVVSAEEGAELFDPDTYRELWGKESAESRRVKMLINTIRARKGWSKKEVADAMQVNPVQLSRWYSGRQQMSQGSMEKLLALYKQIKQEPLRARDMPKGNLTTRGKEK